MAGVPADPWSAGLMALGSVAGKAVEDKAMNSQNSAGASFDNSGWTLNVSTGKGATQSAQADRSQGAALDLGAMLKNPLVLIALAFVAYAVIARK